MRDSGAKQRRARGTAVSLTSPEESPRHQGFNPPLLDLRQPAANLLPAPPRTPPPCAPGPSIQKWAHGEPQGLPRPDAGDERRLRQLESQDGHR